MGNLFKRTAAALAVAVAAIAVNAPMTLTAEAAGGCSGAHSGYTQLSSAALSDGTLGDGSYYLTEALGLDDEIAINGNVTLCLYGNNITAAVGGFRVFNVNDGASLTLCDCKGTGEISGGAVADGQGGAVCVGENGTFTMKGGIISENSAKEGGGVYVNNGGKFEMSGGTISGNTAKHQGGGVYVNSDGTFTMSGGTISENKATDSTDKSTAGGGGVYTAGAFTLSGGEICGNIANECYGGGVCVSGDKAVFTLKSGTISGNTANNWYGGGVHVSHSGTVEMSGGMIANNSADSGGGGISMGGGTFTIKGGSISDNTSTYGGGAYLNGGEFKLSGGTLSNNSAGQGGGAYLGKGTFTMNNGTLSNNEANTDGGGVYLGGGDFNMSGGTLSKNDAARNGGGVFLNKGAFNMSGGEITSNTAKLGSCVYVGKTDGGGTMTLSGRVTIKSDTDSNVFLADGKTITIGSNFSAANPIGIHPETPPVKCTDIVSATEFAENVPAKNISAYFKADKEPKIIVYEDDEIKLKGEHGYDHDADWEKDTDNHWHECEWCSLPADTAKHKWDKGTITRQPTSAEAGEIKYVCTVCAVEKTSPLPYRAPSTSSGSGNSSSNRTGSSNRASDNDSGESVVPVNPPTGHNTGALAALAIAALAAASTRKRR